MRQEAIQDLLEAVDKRGALAIHHIDTDLVRINHEITVAIAVGRCRVSGLGYPRWFSKADRRPLPHIFVLIRMNPGDLTVRDYLITPACEIAGKRELHANNGARLDSYLFPTLEPLVALADRVFVEGAI